MMSREGEVLFNGAKMEKHMKRAIGYVMQDDLLYESLTVFEVVSDPLSTSNSSLLLPLSKSFGA